LQHTIIAKQNRTHQINLRYNHYKAIAFKFKTVFCWAHFLLYWTKEKKWGKEQIPSVLKN
ncbi:hypothetical protein DLF47_RS22120, partial [Escherichia coli O157]